MNGKAEPGRNLLETLRAVSLELMDGMRQEALLLSDTSCDVPSGKRMSEARFSARLETLFSRLMGTDVVSSNR